MLPFVFWIMCSLDLIVSEADSLWLAITLPSFIQFVLWLYRWELKVNNEDLIGMLLYSTSNDIIVAADRNHQLNFNFQECRKRRQVTWEIDESEVRWKLNIRVHVFILQHWSEYLCLSQDQGLIYPLKSWLPRGWLLEVRPLGVDEITRVQLSFIRLGPIQKKPKGVHSHFQPLGKCCKKVLFMKGLHWTPYALVPCSSILEPAEFRQTHNGCLQASCSVGQVQPMETGNFESVCSFALIHRS